jgi:hypothetical protein
VAAILFVGAVTGNLIASYLQTALNPYQRWVWLIFAIAFVVTVVVAIVEARQGERPPVSLREHADPISNEFPEEQYKSRLKRFCGFLLDDLNSIDRETMECRDFHTFGCRS